MTSLVIDTLRQHMIDKIVAFNKHHLAGLPQNQKLFIQFIDTLFAMQGSEFFNQLLVDEKLQAYAAVCLDLWQHYKNYTPSATPDIYAVSNHCAPSQHFFTIISRDYNYILRSIQHLLKVRGIKYVNMMHPVFAIKRDVNGVLNHIEDPEHDAQWDGSYESIVHFLILSPLSDASIEQLKTDIYAIFEQITVIQDGHVSIEEKLHILSDVLFKNTEEGAFLSWLSEDYYYFYGYRFCSFNQDVCDEQGANHHATSAFHINYTGQLGLFNLASCNENAHLFPLVEASRTKGGLLLRKSDVRSFVNTHSRYDIIELPKRNTQGDIIGVYQFIGAFTPDFFDISPSIVPIARTNVTSIFKKFGFNSNWYNGRLLKTIIDSIPLDFFFQLEGVELTDICKRVIKNQKQINFYIRGGITDSYLTILIFLPFEKYSFNLKNHIKQHLEGAFNGIIRSEHISVQDQLFTRMVFVLDREIGDRASIDYALLQKELLDISQSWEEQLLNSANYDLAQKILEIFPKTYQDDCLPTDALKDYSDYQKMIQENKIIFNLYAADHAFWLHVFNPRGGSILSDIFSILNKFGIDVWAEHSYPLVDHHNEYKAGPLRQNGGTQPILQRFLIQVKGNNPQSVDFKKRFLQALNQVWVNVSENDALNQLIAKTSLNVREIMCLRALIRFSTQTGLNYSVDFITDALNQHYQFAQQFMRAFRDKFHPKLHCATQYVHSEKVLQDYCGQLEKIDDDKILRHLLNLLTAMTRTNYYQSAADIYQNSLNMPSTPCNDAGPEGLKSYLSFKFYAPHIVHLPKPTPLYEIFVYSSCVEGVHLRGDKVARGGIRWSDRSEDYRHEILGLMKSQMVKNAVIIPLGSKGGFIVKGYVQAKQQGMTSPHLKDMVIRGYQQFISALLDITDNLHQGQIVKPKNCVCHDEDDPYLVVAADKGTASFSDIANDLSRLYNFWLGDAFASGGSKGYSHKKMGITARGAWVSIAHHFQDKGIDIYAQEFSVIGVGDMSGDVFGNGMLQSPFIKLVGAFNHEYIFFDPAPDCQKSFRARQHLFENPHLKWCDYHPDALSLGGGIFRRSCKIIAVTPEMQNVLHLPTDQHTITPDNLIKALLQAPVDLLYFGGIGTFIKASHESHNQSHDKANDDIRVDAKDVQAKIIGEGANLAVTQLGRIEFALLGGAINTDAIDNSAGVDCSDHEVNLKIFFNQLIQKNALTYAQRDDLMRSMEASVAQLVLNDTAQQVFLLSVLAHGAHNNTSVIEQFVDDMEKHPKMPLNKQLEYLPEYEELSNRFGQGQGFTRPELAIITAYAKNQLYQKLMEYIDPHLYEPYYMAYFPRMMVLNYREQLKNHPLQKEILCTVLANYIINRCGPHFIHGIMNARGAAHQDIVHAFFAIHQITNLGDVWDQVSESVHLSLKEKYRAWGKLSNIMRQMIMGYLRQKSILDQRLSSDISVQFQNFLMYLTRSALTVDLDIEKLMNHLSYYPLALELCSSTDLDLVPAMEYTTEPLKHLWDSIDFSFLMALLNENKFETSWEIGTKYNLDDDIVSMMVVCMIRAMNQGEVPRWLGLHMYEISLYQNHLKIAKCAYISDGKNLGVISYIVKQLDLLKEQLVRGAAGL